MSAPLCCQMELLDFSSSEWQFPFHHSDFLPTIGGVEHEVRRKDPPIQDIFTSILHSFDDPAGGRNNVTFSPRALGAAPTTDPPLQTFSISRVRVSTLHLGHKKSPELETTLVHLGGGVICCRKPLECPAPCPPARRCRIAFSVHLWSEVIVAGESSGGEI